jgi:calcineurin-like phosphoesterase family protein
MSIWLPGFQGAAGKDEPQVWLSSDLHIGHARIIELSGRPFSDVASMDESLIEAHNAVVGPNDIALNLGDLCLGPFADSVAKTSRMNGRRFLVPGNHDRVSSVFGKGKNIDRFRGMYEDAGWTVLPENIVIELGGHRFAVSHYPYQGDHTENDRHVNARPVDRGLPLLHGHIHAQRRIDGRMFNVGVDVNGFAPVSAAEAVAFASSAPQVPQMTESDVPFFDVRAGALS